MLSNVMFSTKPTFNLTQSTDDIDTTIRLHAQGITVSHLLGWQDATSGSNPGVTTRVGKNRHLQNLIHKPKFQCRERHQIKDSHEKGEKGGGPNLVRVALPQPGP